MTTRAELANVVAAVTRRGQNAYVAISNHAEGCAPLTVRALAEAVAAAGTPGATEHHHRV